MVFLDGEEKEDPFRTEPLRNLIAKIIFYLLSLMVMMVFYYLILEYYRLFFICLSIVTQKDEGEEERERK